MGTVLISHGIARLMKHLAAMLVVRETGLDLYEATNLTSALTEPRYRDGIPYLYVPEDCFHRRRSWLTQFLLCRWFRFNVAGPSFAAIPKFLERTSHQNPGDIANGPLQFAHGTSKPFWELLGEKPAMLQCFNNYMSGYRHGKTSWCHKTFYPVDERLNEPGDDAVLLVDVGGGVGHDIREFRSNNPDVAARGRLILQDRPEVIKGIQETNGFEATVHDFFTEQPARGTSHVASIDKKLRFM